MNRKVSINVLIGAVLLIALGTNAKAADMDSESKASFDIVMSIMGAVGSGDMETAISLMADDMGYPSPVGS